MGLRDTLRHGTDEALFNSGDAPRVHPTHASNNATASSDGTIFAESVQALALASVTQLYQEKRGMRPCFPRSGRRAGDIATNACAAPALGRRTTCIINEMRVVSRTMHDINHGHAEEELDHFTKRRFVDSAGRLRQAHRRPTYINEVREGGIGSSPPLIGGGAHMAMRESAPKMRATWLGRRFCAPR